ncbi:oxidoreductase C-terminal domain-containing protein [Streptomyces sp. NPDC001604]|uniref:oxidoreductase C-terminal domain-containing protein n=1 Tax=Streptomyces sp. NPDC001604 TaxID=3364593 RepID=UPI00368330B8
MPRPRAPPAARNPLAAVPYFCSDRYDKKIQGYGCLRGADEVAVPDGDLAKGRFVAACSTGERVSGALAVGMPPRARLPWRQAVAAGAVRAEAGCAGATVPGA